MTNDIAAAYAGRKKLIRDAVDDTIEHLFDRLTGEDDWFDEKMQELSLVLGIVTQQGLEEGDDAEMERHQDLEEGLVRAAWMGLIERMVDGMKKVHTENTVADFA